MSAWEYLPHRWLINKSLRKSSDELRAKIDACQIEYDRRVEACKIELEQEEEKKNRELDEFRSALNLQLQNDQVLLDEIFDDVTQYVDKYLYGKYIDKFLDAKRRLYSVLQEEKDFLSNQMNSIRSEIEVLEQRKTVLVSFTDVHDIVRLMELSGYEIQTDSITDAPALLKTINFTMSKFGEKQEVEKFALHRLKNIVQQRTDYLYIIQYINWVIQQKEIFSKQLSIKRDNIRKKEDELSAEIKETVNAKRALKHNLMRLAEKVRMHWARPITYLSADIDFLNKEKNEKIQKRKDRKEKRRDIGAKLHTMSESHTNDQIRWNELQREGKKLTSEIDDLNDDIIYLSSKIGNAKKERKEWIDRKKGICDLIINHTEFFDYGKEISVSDECKIIESRLAEIDEIRAEGTKSAEQKCDEEKTEIKEKYKVIKKMASEQLAQAEIEWIKAEEQVQDAGKKLEEYKHIDNRRLWTKLFFETDEVASAKKELRRKKQNCTMAKEKVNNEKNRINKNLEEATRDFEQKIRQCTPRYLRPTADEILEEKKLKLRKQKLLDESEN